MANGDTPLMSESLGMPASMATQPPVQPQPASQPVQPVQPTQPVQPIEPPTHHHALGGVLAAIAGPPPPVHQINPQTGQMTTLPGKDSPGDAFRRILSGALIGMGAGAAAGAQGHPGAGILGGIGAGGTAVMNRQQALNQQDIENQQKNFDEQQKAQLNKATIAHLNQEAAKTTWEMQRGEAELDLKTAEESNKMAANIAKNSANKKIGHYTSFDDLIQNHQADDPDLIRKQSEGLLQVVPIFKGGKPQGVDVYEIHPAWGDQPTTEPTVFHTYTGKDKDGNDQYKDLTVPAGAWSNEESNKAQLAFLEKEMVRQQALKPSDEQRFVADSLKGQGLPDTPANRAKEALRYRTASASVIATAGQGALGGPTTPGGAPSGLDMAAENYFQTGQLPNVGRYSGAVNTEIINRAAQLHPNATGELAFNRAAYGANKKSLDQVTETLTMLTGFESAATKNLKMFTDSAQKVVDSGVPWVNQPLRNINKNLLGDKDQAAYEAARGVAQREIARVVNNPKLTGVLTNEARNELNAYNPNNATLGQTLAVAKVLQQDMANVRQGLTEQQRDLQTRLKGGAGGGQGGGAGTTGVIYARDPKGQLHQAKPGTALPPGWKAEPAPAPGGTQ